MKHRYLLALTLSALLFTACAKPARDEVAETTTAVTVATGETSAIETTAETEITTETTVTEADAPIMRPIPSGEPFEVMACEITELPLIKTEEDFPNQADLKLAKELCFNDEYVQHALIRYNEAMEEQEGSPIETAEDIKLDQGVSFDFDGDGENESIFSLRYTPAFMGGADVIYIDGDKHELLIQDINPSFKASVLEFDGYSFIQLDFYAGAVAYIQDIYSFESGMPEKVFDIRDSHGIRYENGIFYCYVKYNFTEYPFVFCTDGKFRQPALEEITREDFIAHLDNGDKFLDYLAEKDITVTEIRTAGYYSYWLRSTENEWYLTPYEDNEYDEYGNSPYAPPYVQFTDELIYGKDIWSAVPLSSSDPAEKIWNFLSNPDYTDGHTTDKYFLFDFNGDDFPEVAFVGWDEDMFYSTSYPYMHVYDLSGSEPVSLGCTSQGLSPYSDDEQCIGLYCNEKGEYFYHSLAYYILKSSKGYSYNFERFIIPVDFGSHSVEFTLDPTEQRSFDNESDAEKYKESVFKELEQLTLVTELKTSYMAEDANDEEAFRAMLAEFPQIN